VTVLVVVEHESGSVPEAGREAITAARGLAESLSTDVTAVVIGNGADEVVDTCRAFGASTVVIVADDALTDFGPDAWAEATDAAIEHVDPEVVVAVGSDRGNEVLAHVGARRDLPFVANALRVDPGDPWALERVQWGGSLLEDVTLETPLPLLTYALHGVEAQPAEHPTDPAIESIPVALSDAASTTLVVDRTVLSSGVTLPTAPVVVGGGRGVGSAEGFASLEELAGLLGGVVGCSRAVTNNGWRPHRDQVGQTGTRIAPEIYIASGISGAIQHWVGAAASKQILAINTDPAANMVAKADYAVIADLHEVIPAISAEIRRRHS
jgi:electron transfer flavoprotein alpha subunit